MFSTQARRWLAESVRSRRAAFACTARLTSAVLTLIMAGALNANIADATELRGRIWDAENPDAALKDSTLKVRCVVPEDFEDIGAMTVLPDDSKKVVEKTAVPEGYKKTEWKTVNLVGDGTYSIRGIPLGKCEIRIRQPRPGKSKDARTRPIYFASDKAVVEFSAEVRRSGKKRLIALPR